MIEASERLRRLPPAVLALLALAAADYLVRLLLLRTELTLEGVVLSLAGAAGPLLLAAVALLVIPHRRLFVGGALLLSAAGLLGTLVRLVSLADAVLLVILLLIAGGTIVGVVMLGRSLAGSLPPWALLIVAVAVAVAVARMIVLAQLFGAAGVLEGDDAPFGRAQLLVAAVAQLAVVAWAYLLAVALGRRYRLVALGALMAIAAAVVMAAGELISRQTGESMLWLFTPALLLEAAAPLVLIGAVLYELRPARAAATG